MFPFYWIICNWIHFIGKFLRGHIFNSQSLAGAAEIISRICSEGTCVWCIVIEYIFDVFTVVFNRNGCKFCTDDTGKLTWIVACFDSSVVYDSNACAALVGCWVLADRSVVCTAVKNTVVYACDTCAAFTYNKCAAAAASYCTLVFSCNTAAYSSVYGRIEAWKAAFLSVDSLYELLGLGIDTADTVIYKTFIHCCNTACNCRSYLKITVDNCQILYCTVAADIFKECSVVGVLYHKADNSKALTVKCAVKGFVFTYGTNALCPYRIIGGNDNVVVKKYRSISIVVVIVYNVFGECHKIRIGADMYVGLLGMLIFSEWRNNNNTLAEGSKIRCIAVECWCILCYILINKYFAGFCADNFYVCRIIIIIIAEAHFYSIKSVYHDNGLGTVACFGHCVTDFYICDRLVISVIDKAVLIDGCRLAFDEQEVFSNILVKHLTSYDYNRTVFGSFCAYVLDRSFWDLSRTGIYCAEFRKSVAVGSIDIYICPAVENYLFFGNFLISFKGSCTAYYCAYSHGMIFVWRYGNKGIWCCREWIEVFAFFSKLDKLAFIIPYLKCIAVCGTLWIGSDTNLFAVVCIHVRFVFSAFVVYEGNIISLCIEVHLYGIRYCRKADRYIFFRYCQTVETVWNGFKLCFVSACCNCRDLAFIGEEIY